MHHAELSDFQPNHPNVMAYARIWILEKVQSCKISIRIYFYIHCPPTCDKLEYITLSKPLSYTKTVLNRTFPQPKVLQKIMPNTPPTNTPSDNSQSIPAATSGSRSKLLSGNFKTFLSKPALTHPQKALTVELHNAQVKSNSSGFSKK
jgi:hypothetical protein